MPRRATQPRYYASRHAYYVQYQGKQRLLAVGPICFKCAEREADGAIPTCKDCKAIRYKADLAFAEMVHASEIETAADNNPLIAVLDRYLLHAKRTRKENGFNIADRAFRPFIAQEYGSIKVKDLKPLQISEFLARMSEIRVSKDRHGVERKRRWGKSTQNVFITNLQTALNWAVAEGIITRNPIAGMRRPKCHSRRTEECLVSPEDHTAMMSISSPSWQDLLFALDETGARPSEIINVTAADFHEDRGTWEFTNRNPEQGFTHKTAHKDRDRTVYLSAAMVALCRRLREKNPTGPLFRDKWGRPFTLRALIQRFETMRRHKKVSINKKITASSYRHTFATNYLLHGGPATNEHPKGTPGSIALLAELLGNSIAMMERHYGHLCKNHVALRNALLIFKNSGSEGSDISEA